MAETEQQTLFSINMQPTLLFALFLALFSLGAIAAPTGEIANRKPDPYLRLPRIPVVEEAREPKPIPEPGCTLYSCT
ncbi:hypothetical protein DFH06DRAFT_1198968 [Mycena polygramma]|nr:hypothetical protein DFH06DRAFT_1198968 [Mycena polygramma]